MGPELTVSAPLEFAIELAPHPLNIISLTIEGSGDPTGFLRLLTEPIEGFRLPYPVLQELHLALSIPGIYEIRPKKRIEAEVKLRLRTLWECRGTPANSFIVLDVFNSKGVSYYRGW